MVIRQHFTLKKGLPDVVFSCNISVGQFISEINLKILSEITSEISETEEIDDDDALNAEDEIL